MYGDIYTVNHQSYIGNFNFGGSLPSVNILADLILSSRNEVVTFNSWIFNTNPIELEATITGTVYSSFINCEISSNIDFYVEGTLNAQTSTLLGTVFLGTSSTLRLDGIGTIHTVEINSENTRIEFGNFIDLFVGVKRRTIANSFTIENLIILDPTHINIYITNIDIPGLLINNVENNDNNNVTIGITQPNLVTNPIIYECIYYLGDFDIFHFVDEFLNPLVFNYRIKSHYSHDFDTSQNFYVSSFLDNYLGLAIGPFSPSVTPTSSSTPSNTPSNTPTKTSTPTPTNTQTPTNTDTPSNTPTLSNTPTSSMTPLTTISGTPTPTSSVSETPTSTSSVSETTTTTPTPTSSETSSETSSVSASLSTSFSFSPTPTDSQTPSSTISPTQTPSLTSSNSPSDTPSSTITISPSSTPIFSTVSPTTTSTSTPSLSIKGLGDSATTSITPSNTPSFTSTISRVTKTSTPTSTLTPMPFESVTPTTTGTIFIIGPTPSSIPFPSNSDTPTGTATFTQTLTPSLTGTATFTQTLTPSLTETPSSTETYVVSLMRSESIQLSKSIEYSSTVSPSLSKNMESSSSTSSISVSVSISLSNSNEIPQISMNAAPPLAITASPTTLHSVIPTSATRSLSNSPKITVSNETIGIGGVIVPEFDISGNKIVVDLPNSEIISSADNSFVFSTIVNVDLQDRNLVLDDTVEICFIPNSSEYDKDSLCLGYLDESVSPPEWICADKCLDSSDDYLCGKTDHFTNFALLLTGLTSNNKAGDCESPKEDYVLAWISLAFICAAIVIVALSVVVVEYRYSYKKSKVNKRLRDIKNMSGDERPTLSASQMGQTGSESEIFVNKN